MSLGTFYATWQAAKPGRGGGNQLGLWLWQFKIMNHTQTVADRERVLHAEPSQPQLGSRRVEASRVTWPGHMADYADSCRVFGYLLCLHCLLCSALALGQHCDGIGASLAARAGAAAGACWEVSTLYSPPLSGLPCSGLETRT